MRITLTFLMMLPVVIGAQELSSTASGHFEGWPDSLQWGANKQTLEVMTVSLVTPRLSLFSVSDRGFGWSQPFTGDDGVFNAWSELTGWCRDSEELWLQMGVGQLRGIGSIDGEESLPIVNEYFIRFAGDLDIDRSDQECNRDTFRPPPPPDERAEIVEMLEAAMEERRDQAQ